MEGSVMDEDNKLMAGCVLICALTLVLLAASIVLGALVGWPYGVALFCATQGAYWLAVGIKALRLTRGE